MEHQSAIDRLLVRAEQAWKESNQRTLPMR